MCSKGAAEDDRAPTEELSCVRGRDFCSTGAAEDDRAPTEERSCVRGRDFCSVVCVSAAWLLPNYAFESGNLKSEILNLKFARPCNPLTVPGVFLGVTRFF